MPFQRIISYSIVVGPGGGRIYGKLDNGQPFDEGRNTALPYSTLAALTAVINGPNPGYDPDNKTFICGRDFNNFGTSREFAKADDSDESEDGASEDSKSK